MNRLTSETLEQAQSNIRILFKNREGLPFEATPMQAEIYAVICMTSLPRIHILAMTQYGKSELASMALLTLCSIQRQKVAIIAPGEKQAQIIMGNIIDHVFDNKGFESLVDMEGSKDRFKRQRTRNRIDFKNAGSVMVLSAEASNIKKQAKGLMGFGADVIVIDESSLIPDIMYTKILRMVGGTAGRVIQLGNSWERNHFYKDSINPNYYKIHIDYNVALTEGRITEAFLNEIRALADPLDWQVLYEAKFPDSASDALIPMTMIEQCIEKTDVEEGVIAFGGDVARFGGDTTVGVIRNGGNVLIHEKVHGQDTMGTVGMYRKMIDDYNPSVVNVDSIGVGAGVVDRLKEEGYPVTGVGVGEKSLDSERFANLRAEIFWGLRQRFLSGDISIPNDPDLIIQLGGIKFSYNSRGQILIEGKEAMKRRGLKSPDIADALALCFYTPPAEELASIDVF